MGTGLSGQPVLTNDKRHTSSNYIVRNTKNTDWWFIFKNLIIFLPSYCNFDMNSYTDLFFGNYYHLQSVRFELLYTALVLYAVEGPVPSCKSPMQVSMVGVSNCLWNYPSRPMFVLVAICCLAMC